VIKNVSGKNSRHDKACGSQAQGISVTFMVSAVHPPPSLAEKKSELKGSEVKALPPQFEESLSRITRRLR